MEHPYKLMFEEAMRWIPSWHPGRDEVRPDWTCDCGRTWISSHELRLHALQEHPDRLGMSLQHHDRYPWENIAPVDKGEE